MVKCSGLLLYNLRRSRRVRASSGLKSVTFREELAMRPARLAVVAAVVAAAGSVVAGQTPAPQTPPSNVQPPPMSIVLGGKSFVAPVRGAADVEYAPPTTKRDKDFVVTKFLVRNPNDKPIARLTITETWY